MLIYLKSGMTTSMPSRERYMNTTYILLARNGLWCVAFEQSFRSDKLNSLRHFQRAIFSSALGKGRKLISRDIECNRTIAQFRREPGDILVENLDEAEMLAMNRTLQRRMLLDTVNSSTCLIVNIC